MRGTYWEPVLFVWHKGNSNRLPEIGVLPFEIWLNDAFSFIASGHNTVMQLVQFCHYFEDNLDYRSKESTMENSIHLFAAAKVKIISQKVVYIFLFYTAIFKIVLLVFKYQEINNRIFGNFF